MLAGGLSADREDPFTICCAAQSLSLEPRAIGRGDGRLRRPSRAAAPLRRRLPDRVRSVADRPQTRKPRASPACAAGPAPRPRSAAFAFDSGTTTLRASSCSGQLGAPRRRSRRRGSASPARRNGRAIDGCARSAARARARRSARRARRRAPAPARASAPAGPFGSTFIHQPRLSSSRPSGRSIAPLVGLRRAGDDRPVGLARSCPA